MNTYRLKPDSQCLHPSMMNSFRACAKVSGIVTEDNKVQYQSFTFSFSDAENEGITMQPGTKVLIWLTNDFQCASVHDVEKEQAERMRMHLEAEQQHIQQIETKKASEKLRAKEVNSKINLPTKWLVGIKDVLSGLSENSDGSGRKSNTVNHIFLPDGLAAGRITRNPGDFLCTPKSGTNGKQWSNQPIENQSTDNMPEVTCKSCLNTAQNISEKLKFHEKVKKMFTEIPSQDAETRVSLNLDVGR